MPGEYPVSCICWADFCRKAEVLPEVTAQYVHAAHPAKIQKGRDVSSNDPHLRLTRPGALSSEADTLPDNRLAACPNNRSSVPWLSVGIISKFVVFFALLRPHVLV